jgi:hypothetical protein
MLSNTIPAHAAEGLCQPVGPGSHTLRQAAPAAASRGLGQPGSIESGTNARESHESFEERYPCPRVSHSRESKRCTCAIAVQVAYFAPCSLRAEQKRLRNRRRAPGMPTCMTLWRWLRGPAP